MSAERFLTIFFLIVMGVAFVGGAFFIRAFIRAEVSARNLFASPIELLGGELDSDGNYTYPASHDGCYQPGDRITWVTHWRGIREADVVVRRWVKKMAEAETPRTIVWSDFGGLFVGGVEEGDELEAGNFFVIPEDWEGGDYFILTSAMADSQASFPVRYRVYFSIC